MIFIDSNVPMCLVGAAHPSKIAAQQLLERAIATRIMTFDADFDRVPGLSRISS